MNIKDLVRPEVLNLKPYVPAKKVLDKIRLNANESPYSVTRSASEDSLNLYPDARPDEIRSMVASYLKISSENIVITRGSTEAIDVSIRTFCVPDKDGILVFPPTFEMYKFYAEIQGIKMHTILLDKENRYSLDMKAIEIFDPNQAKLIFICSPSNPLGHTLSDESIFRVCEHFSESGLVILDGAYVEFDDDGIYQKVLSKFDNVIMLRTLSKAFGLAGVRCGALISSPEICQFIERVIPPYSFSTPAVNAVVDSLSDEGIKESKRNIKTLLEDRKWLSQALESLDTVTEVFPSHTNFILVRVNEAKDFCQKANDSGFLLRDVSYQPMLDNCVRITVGNSEQNQKLIRGLSS
tara:strand:+ start:42822 stop:43877 length:1056 start_codon:yes stop_codon:yes gene_type:complete